MHLWQSTQQRIQTCRSKYCHIKDCYLCNFNSNIVHLLVLLNKCIRSLLINIFGINLNEISISFKFIPKILMSKECIHFFRPLCIWKLTALSTFQRVFSSYRIPKAAKDVNVGFFFHSLTFKDQPRGLVVRVSDY